MHTTQQLGHSFDESVKATAATQLSSPSRLRELYDEFQSTGTITPPDNSQDGFI